MHRTLAIPADQIALLENPNLSDEQKQEIAQNINEHYGHQALTVDEIQIRQLDEKRSSEYSEIIGLLRQIQILEDKLTSRRQIEAMATGDYSFIEKVYDEIKPIREQYLTKLKAFQTAYKDQSDL